MSDDPNRQPETLNKLLQVMAMLRHTQHGCPWDLEQSLDSLTRYTLEEVYEVVDAIERQSPVQLRDELGDLLFQIVFYARIAEEQGLFKFNDVAQAITDKLIRRHPHVFPQGSMDNFGQAPALTADEVVANWEAIKQAERQIAAGQQQRTSGILDDVPLSLPGLARAIKLQRRAATVGFDWQELEPVIAKIREELEELEAALAADDSAGTHAELGDLLFATANLARHIQVDPETALRATNRKFESRFRFMEQRLAEQGSKMQDLSLAELDQYWELAKQAE